jgi:hypothetical protein
LRMGGRPKNQGLRDSVDEALPAGLNAASAKEHAHNPALPQSW